VVSVREGAHRKIGHVIVKKEPITPDILQTIVLLYGNKTCNLKDLRITCMCLLGYAGFLRFSELASLKRSDISSFPSYVKLYLEKSKTEVYREEREGVISKHGTITCLVDMLDRYLKLAGTSENSVDYILRYVSFCKSTDSYQLRNSCQISYTRARGILLSALKAVGLDKRQFGLHSLRSGGATVAAAVGIDDILFKKHGCWKSDKAKDGNVNENIHVRLSVSKNLGI
jgi:integrase